MRRWVVICAVLVLCGRALSRDRQLPPPPDRFEIGRHTFFDFGPPHDYYELLLIRPAPGGTSIQRITLTPAAGCTQPAKVETASVVISETVGSLLGPTNPCAIPEKELRRERKRCKKCLVFSGANVALQVQCGSQTRVIRADILDRDMFDPAAKTLEHTSWTMQLLDHLDHAIGPGVMEKPIFALPTKDEPAPSVLNAEVSQELHSSRYELLFQGRRTSCPICIWPLKTVRRVQACGCSAACRFSRRCWSCLTIPRLRGPRV